MKILFDCDGTLMDSMHIWTQPLYELYDEYNYRPSTEEKGRMEALDFNDMMKWIVETFAHDKTEDEVYNLFKTIINEGYRESLMPKDGVMELLDTLKNENIEMAIASSTDYHLLEMLFNRLDIFDYFKFIQTADTCDYNKGDKEYWLLAAEKLEADPSDIILFDDALYAIKAANSAGIKTCGLKDFPHNEGEWEEIKKHSDMFLDSLADLDLNILK